MLVITLTAAYSTILEKEISLSFMLHLTRSTSAAYAKYKDDEI